MARARTIRETEVKLRVVDLPRLLAKLKRIGAACNGRVFEQNTLFDTPEEDFRRRRRLLRLRTETPAGSSGIPAGSRKAVLTSKAPVPNSGSRYKEKLERELSIRVPGKWPGVLRSLGFRPGFRYEKYRTTFRLRGLQAEVDETPVGVFLELEGSPDAIDRVAGLLGFSARDYFRGTYWDLFQEDCRRRGETPKNMRFTRKK
jgi:adenylate cyclase, class 2